MTSNISIPSELTKINVLPCQDKFKRKSTGNAEWLALEPTPTERIRKAVSLAYVFLRDEAELQIRQFGHRDPVGRELLETACILKLLRDSVPIERPEIYVA